MFSASSFNNRKGYKSNQPRRRTMKIESLEERDLLSVSPLDTYMDDTANVAAVSTQTLSDNLDAELPSSDHTILQTRVTKYITPLGYNDNDYQKIVAFLEQTDANGVKNGTKINSRYDPLYPSTFLTLWSEKNGEQRITGIGNSWGYGPLVGDLDVSNMTYLTSLYCYNYQLTSLDISGCTALTLVYVNDNQLSSLNASGCTALEFLECSDNQLSSLNLYGCVALETLYCESNNLYNLNLSTCSNLEELYCSNNYFSSLDLSNHTALCKFECISDRLKTLNLSGCTSAQIITKSKGAVGGFGIDCPSLETLDVSGCTNLKEIRWSSSETYRWSGSEPLSYSLKALNVAGCTKLEDLYVDYNQLSSLDLRSCTNLDHLYIGGNPQLSRVYLSNNAINNLYVKFDGLWSIHNSTGSRLVDSSRYYYYPTELPFTATNPSNTQTIVFSSTISTKLDSPSLSVGANGSNSISVNIGSVANASGYTVQYSKYSNFTSATTVSFQSSGYHSINDLDPNTTYYVRVKANGTGNYSDSNYSAYSTVKTNSQTSQLTGLTLSTNSPIVGEAIAATVTPSAATCTYQWSYSSSPSGTFYNISDATSASYTPTSTYSGKYLKCTVTGTGNYSGVVSAVTTNAVSQTIDNVGDSISNAKEIAFTNDAFTFTDKLGEGIYGLKDVDIYKLFVSASDINRSYTFTTSQPSGGASVDTYIRLFDSTGNELVSDDDSGNDNRYSSLTWTPPSSGSYYLGVSSYYNCVYDPAIAGSSESDGSAGDYTLTVTRTGSVKLFTPTLSVSSTTSDSITIFIGSVANAAGFKAQYATDSNFTDAMEVIFDESGYNVINDLEPDQTYHIRVMALGSDNYSDSNFSSVKTTKTKFGIKKLQAPTFTVTVTGANSVSVNVESVTNASGYSVEYSTDSDFSNAKTTNISSGTASLNGLGDDSTTYIRVKTIGNGVSYADSNYSSVQTVAVGSASIAQKDLVETAQNNPITINYYANDNVTDWSLTTIQFGEAAHGTYVVNADGTITYTPEYGFFGMDSIGYGIVSPSGRIDIGEISIYVGPAIATSVQKTSAVHTPSTPMSNNAVSLTDWEDCYIELWAYGVNALEIGSASITLEYNPAIYNAPVISNCAAGVTMNVSQTIPLFNGNVQVELTAQIMEPISSQTENVFFGTVVLSPSEDGAGVNNILTSEPVCVLNGISLTQTVAAMPYDLVRSGTVDVEDFVAFATVFGLNPENMSSEDPMYAQAIQADFNKDGVVNVDDFIMFATNFGASKAAAVNPVAQPGAATELRVASCELREDEVNLEFGMRNAELIDSQVESSEMELTVPAPQPESPISQNSPCGASVIALPLVAPLPPSNHSQLETEAYSAALLDLYDNQDRADLTGSSDILAESRMDEPIFGVENSSSQKTTSDAIDAILQEDLLAIDWKD